MAIYQARPHPVDQNGRHDDRYLTESETVELLDEKADQSDLSGKANQTDLDDAELSISALEARTGTVLNPDGTVVTGEVGGGYIPTGPEFAAVQGGVDRSDARVYDVTHPSYGGWHTDGTTDNTATLNNVLAAWYAGGGGAVLFPPGVSRIDGLVTLPNDNLDNGGPAPWQPSGRWVGAGGWASGRNVSPIGGTILEMRYNGSEPAKILTLGQGALEVTGITFRDEGGDDKPFIRTTNTTVWIHHCAFFGAKNGVLADQDCIVLGGTNTGGGTDADGTSNGPFQGYGSVVEANYFNRIRRGVLFQTYANAVVVQNNTAMHQCGSNIGADAAFIQMLPSNQTCAGNVVTGNLIEMVGYTVGIRCKDTVNNTFAYNNFYDEGGQVTSEYYFDEGAEYNQIIEGFRNDAKTLMYEHASVAGNNSVISSHQNQPTIFAAPVHFAAGYAGAISRDTMIARGIHPNPAIQIEGVSGNADVWPAFNIRRASDHTYPSSTIYQILQQGNQTVRGSQAGHAEYQAEDGTPLVEWTANGRRWAAIGSGSQFTIDSGSGGSFLLLKNYGIKLQDHTGGNEIIVKNGAGSPEGVLNAPVGSMYLRTDGAAGTTLYIKEVGTGNTGWAAK